MFDWLNNWIKSKDMTTRVSRFWDARETNKLALIEVEPADFTLEVGDQLGLAVNGEIVFDRDIAYELPIRRVMMVKGDIDGLPAFGILVAHDPDA